MINLTHEVIDVPKTNFTEGVNAQGHASSVRTTSNLISVTPGATYQTYTYDDNRENALRGYIYNIYDQNDKFIGHCSYITIPFDVTAIKLNLYDRNKLPQAVNAKLIRIK